MALLETRITIPILGWGVGGWTSPFKGLLPNQDRPVSDENQELENIDENEANMEDLDNRRLFYPYQSYSLYPNQNYPMGRMR